MGYWLRSSLYSLWCFSILVSSSLYFSHAVYIDLLIHYKNETTAIECWLIDFVN